LTKIGILINIEV